MKTFTFDLRRVPAPKPVTPEVCVACKAFRAECVVPVGEASAPMCWLCAHHVVDHECNPGDAATAECECTPDRIYPWRSARTGGCVQRFEHGDVTREMIEKATPEELLRGSSFSDACRSVLSRPGFAESLRTVRLIGAARETWEEARYSAAGNPYRRSTPVATVAQNATRRKPPERP